MAFLQKKPAVSSNLPLYTLGDTKTLLILGLGNPGKEFQLTRHNVGFSAVDDFAGRHEFPAWIGKKDLKCRFSQHNLGAIRVILAKPTTFMNMSGQAAAAIKRFYKLSNSDIVAVYDELALPFGQIRARVGGESAGHHGIKSIMEHIGENFGRLRIGVASAHSDKTDAADFVLGKFTKDEQSEMPAIIKETGVMLTEFIYGGQLPHDTRSVL